MKLPQTGFVEILLTTHFSAIARMTPSLPQRGRQPKGASPPLDPQYRSFFRCVFTAMLHGTRVERPRAPVVSSGCVLLEMVLAIWLMIKGFNPIGKRELTNKRRIF
jgi:hypothetical protein